MHNSRYLKIYPAFANSNPLDLANLAPYMCYFMLGYYTVTSHTVKLGQSLKS